MNGGHDLGGMHGLGPIDPEQNEPVFHGDWERRVFALTLAMGAHGEWTIDQGRFARENQHPAAYLESSYYEIWLKALLVLLEERGHVSPAELAARVAELEAAKGEAG